jgi:hypothetical protein
MGSRAVSRTAWITAPVAVLGWMFASCHTSVGVTLVGCARATAEPAVGAVHPYPGSPQEPVRGDLAVIFVTTDRPLEALTRFTHHHWFRVVPRGLADDCDETLWSGQVFAATPDECGAEAGTADLYKVYVPLERECLRDHAGSYHGCDGEAVLQMAAANGVALRIGGGQMWGTHSLTSNAVPVPLVVGPDSVTLRGR